MQTSYTQNQAAGQDGLLYDSGFHDVMSFIASEHEIEFGRFVSAHNDEEREIRPPSAAGDITDIKLARGVAVKTHAIMSSDSGQPKYPLKSAVSVLRKGRIWVRVENAVTTQSIPHVRHTANGGDTVRGAISGGSGTGKSQFPGNAKFLKGADAGGLAVLEFDLQ